MAESLSCLVTGATGYIGGRLVPSLLAAGHQVRCMARDPAKLAGRPWSGEIQTARADVQDAAAVRRALDGIDVAYYWQTASSAASGFAADGVTRPGCWSATPWTSGGWRPSSRAGCCGCGPR